MGLSAYEMGHQLRLLVAWVVLGVAALALARRGYLAGHGSDDAICGAEVVTVSLMTEPARARHVPGTLAKVEM